MDFAPAKALFDTSPWIAVLAAKVDPMVQSRKEDEWSMIDRAGPDEHDTNNADPPRDRSSDANAVPPPNLTQLAQDWITLWQSELAAIAADREAQETWQAMITLWAGVAGAMINAMPHVNATDARARDERADQRTRTKPTAGPKAAAAASDPRDAEIERLARHIAALEARLAELEHGSNSRRPGRRKRGA